jgi:hypothetical protein
MPNHSSYAVYGAMEILLEILWFNALVGACGPAFRRAAGDGLRSGPGDSDPNGDPPARIAGCTPAPANAVICLGFAGERFRHWPRHQIGRAALFLASDASGPRCDYQARQVC